MFTKARKTHTEDVKSTLHHFNVNDETGRPVGLRVKIVAQTWVPDETSHTLVPDEYVGDVYMVRSHPTRNGSDLVVIPAAAPEYAETLQEAFAIAELLAQRAKNLALRSFKTVPNP